MTDLTNVVIAQAVLLAGLAVFAFGITELVERWGRK